MSKIVRSIGSAAVVVDGQSHRVVAGEDWDGNDPVVKAYPSLFEDAPRVVRTSVGPAKFKDAPVERGTRAPGEKRARVKKTAPKD